MIDQELCEHLVGLNSDENEFGGDIYYLVHDQDNELPDMRFIFCPACGKKLIPTKEA